MAKISIVGIDNPQEGTYFQLEIFKETSLLPTSRLPLFGLEQAFKYNMLTAPLMLFYFDEDNNWQQRKDSYIIKQLLKDCVEVQEYAKVYFPEFVI